jgi:hypothetical protein
MPIHRRDFMKVLGVSVASLYLTRCRSPFVQQPTCYMVGPLPTATPPVTGATSAREHLRMYWLRFEELTRRSREDTENKFGQELTTGHRATLDELVASGEISAPVADLVHEAYGAAVFHVWRSNAPITCYIIGAPQYAASSADVLVAQSQALNQIAAEGTIDPVTLAKAKSALEHDLSFYALTDEEVQALYDQFRADRDPEQPFPSFEELSLELTPEAQAATQFIIDLLTGK